MTVQRRLIKLLLCAFFFCCKTSENDIGWDADPVLNHFRSQQCRALLQEKSYHNCGYKKSLVQVRAFCEDLHVAYKENPKVDSKEIKRMMIQMCPGQVLPCVKHEYADMCDPLPVFFDDSYVTSSPERPVSIFTFVKDPWTRTLSSYTEIDDHCDFNECGVVPFIRDFRRGDEPNRFIAFLDDYFENRLPVLAYSNHARHQTKALCDIPSNATFLVFRLDDNLKERMKILMTDKMRDIHSTTGAVRDKQQRVLYNRSHGDEDKQAFAVLGKHAASLVRAKQLVCEKYVEDYVCLGFPFPPECQRNGTQPQQYAVEPGSGANATKKQP